jgi:REP element-mobilizing transposase RayT
MAEGKLFYRRHLPHYQPQGATFFVTWRLHGSLPRQALEVLREKGRQAEATGKWREEEIFLGPNTRFGLWDSVLDEALAGPVWLRDPRIAEVVKGSLHNLDGRKYHLIAFCIMPNHVHLVLTPLPIQGAGQSYHFLPGILQSLKGYTARRANQILGRTGPFWQDESYDHVVRDEEELRRVVRYVIYNPVKAGLVEFFEDWRWSYWKL